MKSTFFEILTIVVISMFLSGCGLIPDAETEKKLDGTWIQTEQIHEDGITWIMTETITYNADSHEFDSRLELDLTSPETMHIGSVKYSGTWSASKEKLIGKIDKNSLRFSFSRLLDRSDREEMKKMLMDGLKEGEYIDGGVIVSLSDNAFELRDEEDNTLYKYRRK